jgi:multidrug efflux pump subunit AcrA (membrane-fusion protein)
VELISSNGYRIEVNISEADIAKITAANAVTITFDAFGEDRTFSGTVREIYPSQTVIQEVIYYTVVIDVTDPSNDIKPGMTANLTIHTASRSNVLSVPRRAIKEKNGMKFVQILENNQPVDVQVETGLRADDGVVEITFGLTENQSVITFVKTTAK